MDDWTADISNDPSRDFALCIDISKDGQHRATILRSPTGELVLRWYADETDADVPAAWLSGVLEKSEVEIPR